MQADATSRQGFKVSFWWRIRAFHTISYRSSSFTCLIWKNDPYDKRYLSIFARLAASELYHLHLRSVWWMILDILPARKILKKGVYMYIFYIYNTYSICVYIIHVDIPPFCGDSTRRTWNSHIHRNLSGTSHISGRFAWALAPKKLYLCG